MKRILAILFLTLIVIAVAGYFLMTKKEAPHTSKETSLYKAIPLDAPFFIEVGSLNNFPKGNKVYTTIKKAGLFTAFPNLITKLDSALLLMGEPGTELRSEPFVIVLNLEGREAVTPLFIVKAESSKKEKNLETLISGLYPSPTFSFKRRSYNGEEIFETNQGQGNESFSYSFTNGLLIASRKAIIVEKTIRQIGSENLYGHEGFMQIQKTAAQQAQASVYVNHRFFPALLKKWINPAVLGGVNEFGEVKKGSHKNSISGFSNFAEWTELDLAANGNELQFNGISAAPDSASQYVTIIKRQEPVKVGIDKVLPGNAALYYSLTFSNAKEFFEDLDIYFIHNPSYYAREEKLKRIVAASQYDLKPVFEKLVDNEVGMSFLTVPGDPLQKSTCFIISVKAKSQAKEDLLKWLSRYASTQKKALRELQSTVEIDKELKFDIYKFPYPSFPGIWLGIPFTAASAEYFTFWDNYILFTSSKSSLENLLRDLALDATLAKDAAYIQYRLNIEDKANVHFYMNINDGYPLYNEYFIPGVAGIFKSKEEDLRKLASLNWQVSNVDNLLFHTISLSYSEEVRTNAKTAWQSNIGANLLFRPQFVVNHADPNFKEIIAFDVNNKLHLINSEGRVRWSLQLPEPVLGEIHQVDVMKNGKLQYLFNTKSKIYLIDREGQDVGSYPVALKSPATNPLGVFDYDNNKSYRVFVAGEDKKIYVYDMSGNLVSGWKFGKSDQPVTTPVQHFRVGGKDYIVFKDKSRIYILDRQGQPRVKITERFANSANPLILNTEGTPKMIGTDTKGNVFYLSFDGKVTEKKMPGFGEGHLFTFGDINGDKILEFVFIDNDKLSVISENGKEVFNYTFKNKITSPPGLYTFSSTVKKIGVANTAENRIYLLNPDGSLHQGFPLKGGSGFAIGSLTTGAKRLVLVVGGADGNIYNYRLD